MAGGDRPRADPMRRLREALARFWPRDESLSLLLSLVVVFEFLLPPLLPHEDLGGPLKDVVLSLLLVAGTVTVARERPWVVRLVSALVLLAVPVRWVARLTQQQHLVAWSAATSAVTLALLAVLVVTVVLRPGSVNRRRIEGAVAGYLPLGLAWAGA